MKISGLAFLMIVEDILGKTFALSPPGKAPETLESQNWCVLFLKVGRFH